jgi:hypothetical protein
MINLRLVLLQRNRQNRLPKAVLDEWDVVSVKMLLDEAFGMGMIQG